MNDFIPQVSAAFFGVLAAFSLNYLYEYSRNRRREEAYLIETKYYINAQANFFNHIKFELDNNFEKSIHNKKVKIYLKDIVIFLEDILSENDVSWMQYGRPLLHYNLIEINTNNIVFLSSKGKTSVLVLNKIMGSSLAYKTILLLLKKRDELFIEVLNLADKLGIECSSKEEFIQKLTMNGKFNDNFSEVKYLTEKLNEELTHCIVEFKEYEKIIDAYVEDEYNKSCLKRWFEC